VVIEVVDNPKRERYELRADGKTAGFIFYRLKGGRMTMVHTEVEPAYEGHGLGTDLAKAALADVRERGLDLDLVPEPLRDELL
jgi:predicted GNAT family acetyltransferase